MPEVGDGLGEGAGALDGVEVAAGPADKVEAAGIDPAEQVLDGLARAALVVEDHAVETLSAHVGIENDGGHAGGGDIVGERVFGFGDDHEQGIDEGRADDLAAGMTVIALGDGGHHEVVAEAGGFFVGPVQ